TTNASKFTLLVYTLAANPQAPQLVSSTGFNYEFIQDMLVQGTTVLVPTAGFFSFGDQFGTVLAIDIHDPTAPRQAGVLFNNRGEPTGGDTLQIGGAIVNNQIAYIASSTSTGGNTQSGVGRILVVDYSDPTNLMVLREVDIPGTLHAINVTLQGNRALVVADTPGAGNLMLAVLDITDPAQPQLIGTPLLTAAVNPNPRLDTSGQSLGNGLFVVGQALANGNPVLLLVNASNPNNLVVSSMPVPAIANELTGAGN